MIASPRDRPVRPRALRRGAHVRVVALSGPVPPEPLARGVAVLQDDLGLEVSLDASVEASRGYLAGPDEDRVAALSRALADENVDAVLCARGGYGAGRLLAHLPATTLAGRPVPVVGFSDVTALHAGLLHAGVAPIHGPVVTQLGRLDAESVSRLGDLLFGEAGAGHVVLRGTTMLRDGRAEGPLAGGNLALLASLCGTQWQPALAGRIVVLEDVGEPTYRIDRMVWQLRMAAGLDDAAALVLGDFIDTTDPDGSWLSAFWTEIASELTCPVVAGAPVGHSTTNWAFPLGIGAALDAGDRSVRLLEPAVVV